jgi:ribonucleotide monophosphatase NagD (HAD superfamily)
MKIKKMINFKKLKEGPKTLAGLKKEEIIQLVTNNKRIHSIVRQEFLLELLEIKERFMTQKNPTVVKYDPQQLRKKIEDKMKKVWILIEEDKREFTKNKKKR